MAQLGDDLEENPELEVERTRREYLEKKDAADKAWQDHVKALGRLRHAALGRPLPDRRGERW